MSWQKDLSTAMARLERATNNVAPEERERSIAQANWRRIKLYRDLNSAARLNTDLINTRLDDYYPSGQVCNCKWETCSGFKVKTPGGQNLCPIKISIQVARLHLNGYIAPFSSGLVGSLVMISKRRI